jgi:3-oxoacyl-[acyl-carrier protein] reductase
VGKLSGKVALVTGSSQGIGRAIALALAREGALVLVHGRQASAQASEVVREIEAGGGAAAAVFADLQGDDGPTVLLQQTDAILAQRRGDTGLDILVNNAGVIRRETIECVTHAEFDRTIAVNLRAPFFLIQQSLARLRDGGRIINISSMGARAAFPSMAAYAPAKAA